MDTTANQSTTTFAVTGDWTKQSRQLKETFSQLTSADLKFDAGKEEELISRLQNRLGKTRDEVIDILTSVQPPVPTF